MQEQNINLNWLEFYRKYLRKEPRSCGENEMSSLCPFHDDHNDSFWFNTQTGLWNCATCGGGNATQFYARINNIDTKQAWLELCELACVDPRSQAPKKPGYTVREYALAKRLPEDFLKKLGIERAGKNGIGSYIEIPYFNENGEHTATRKRFGKGGKQRFSWVQGNKPCLYGLWKLDKVRKAGHVILVEGESDTHTLWHLGFSALGVPGADSFKSEWTKKLMSLEKIYIHLDPDDGGQKFLKKIVTLVTKEGYTGQLLRFACEPLGVKDPSDLYLEHGDKAKELLRGLLSDAAPVELEDVTQAPADPLDDMPLRLDSPRDFKIHAQGIERRVTSGPRYGDWNQITWTPILLTRILRTIGSGEEKVELTYRKGGRWGHFTCARSTIAASRSIVELAQHGVDITSENSRHIVAYLSALERDNIDRIPVAERVGGFGWIDDKRFLPGLAPDVVLDIEQTGGRWGHAFEPKGDLATWCEGIQKHRGRAVFRFLLACAFAPPLLRVLGHRNFAVHNWGDSRGGKTAALHCSLSVWGSPEDMKGTFNTTQVGIEIMAGFFSDLPLGIDERQLAGNKQEFIDKLIYMLGGGQGKIRGNKGGGLRGMQSWRTIVLTTGEEPLIGNQSQTGVGTRALEIYGGPFDNEEDASSMYAFTDQNHGHAGVEFVRRLIGADKAALQHKYEQLRAEIRSANPKISQVHIANLALVALADALAEEWIFDGDAERAGTMAVEMTNEVASSLNTEEELDVNQRAFDFFIDWILSNREQFTDRARPTRYGVIRQNRALIYPSIARAAFQSAGYSCNKTLRWMSENGHCRVEVERDGRIRYDPQHKIEGVKLRMYEIFLPFEEEFEEVPTDELPPGW